MKIVYTPDFIVSVKAPFAEVVKFAFEHKASCEPFKIVHDGKTTERFVSGIGYGRESIFLYNKNIVASFLNKEITISELYDALLVQGLYRNKQPIYYRGNIQNLAPFDDCETIEKDSLFKLIDRDLILVDDDQHFQTTLTGIFYEV